MFDPKLVKQDFPILTRRINGKPLVYLDSAATSQKPLQVIDAISNYYKNHNANVHRGVHTLSDESTALWHGSRKTIANFFGADDEELILTRNTTEAINGVRYGWAEDHIQENDSIITTLMEHHSNIVMWQDITQKKHASLEFIQINNDGTLNLSDFKEKIKKNPEKIKLISLVHVSNTLGTVNPIEKIVQIVKEQYPNKNTRPKILIDGAQSAPHMPINFHDLEVDFFVFSGHKMLGPMGIGGLLIRKELLKAAEFKPWLFGGGMISSVKAEKTLFHDDFIERFTAGTPDVASIVGLAEACKYLSNIGMKEVIEHDQKLVEYALTRLQKISDLKIVGPLHADVQRIGSVAFIYNGVHAHDVAQILDSEGIAVRSGHHCTMPLHEAFGWQATTRASFNVYNTLEDIDALVAGLDKVKSVFKI